MQEPHVFESAVIRVVPQVEREEFINVGVILYCKDEKFLQMKFELNESRLSTLFRDLNVSEVRDHLNAFMQICNGGNEGGPIGALPPAERFRWLTATRSTVVQTSKVHPGLCVNAGEMLERLFSQMVKC